MKSVPLNAFPRTAVGRGEVKKLREQNSRVPAVIYGRQTKPENLEIDNLIHHSATGNAFDLSVKDDARAKRLALVQTQHHPLKGNVLPWTARSGGERR
jgi:ribosomal protein L25 (general stress protein Ctc)